MEHSVRVFVKKSDQDKSNGLLQELNLIEHENGTNRE
jgi:hypothetical protein